jgi:sugar (pentulose or hexulose) kinase
MGTTLEYIVTLDLGTTNIKTCVFDSALQEVCVSSGPVRYLREGNRVEFDPEKYWEACAALIRDVVSRSGIDKSRVRSISLTGQAESLVLLDGGLRPLRMGISWMDERSGEECELLKGEIGPLKGYARTGLPDIVTTWPLTKILWIKRREAHVFKRARFYLLIKDFILQKLTGRLLGEHTVYNFSYYFDIARKRYWEEALEAAGVREDQLPGLIGPGETAGTLTGDRSEELGLPGGAVVNTGALDHFAGMIGCGNIREHQVSETTGTVLALATPIRKPVMDELVKGRYRLPCHCGAGNGYVLLPVCESGGVSLDWFRDTVLPGASFSELNTEIERLSGQGSEVIFLPYLTGTNSPEFDQSARGVWFGLRLHHTKFELAKSVMEGVTFLLKKNLAALEETGGPVEEIISLGGGSKSAVWNQMKADVTGKRVIVPSMSEPTSLGAAILASIKCGWFGGVEEAVERGVDIGRVFEPRNPERYERLYERFLELYERLKPVFHGERLT